MRFLFAYAIQQLSQSHLEEIQLKLHSCMRIDMIPNVPFTFILLVMRHLSWFTHSVNLGASGMGQMKSLSAPLSSHMGASSSPGSSVSEPTPC